MIWGLTGYLLIAAAAGIMLGPAGGLGEQIGWAFYHCGMRAAERKAIRRELLRTELHTAMMHYETAQLAHVAALHQHAHTMASLTGQAYHVTGEYTRPWISGAGVLHAPVHMHAEERNERLLAVSDDPRHNPWQLPWIGERP